MSGCIEHDKCDFCHEEKPVWRTYLRPSKYVEPEKIEDKAHLYNQGSYFIIIKTCNDCGEPITNKSETLYTEDDVRFIILKSFLLGVDRGEYSRKIEDSIIEKLKQGKL